MRIIYDPDSKVEPLKLKHVGNVVINAYSEIGPHATIHRSSLGSTVIGHHNFIGSYANIGHNVKTGNNCCFTPYVCVGGSVKIGSNVVMGMGAIIRDNVSICDRVRIGMGSLVVKDIKEPGLYFGSPAERKGDWDGVW
jgi:UDP-3-O-[3-hydroxymyristoyl] glucosamine N-acyltransferase